MGRAKPVAPSGQRAQLALLGIWVSGERATILPTHPGRKASSQPNLTTKHSLMSHSCRKPGQRTQIAKKPILRPCLGRAKSDALPNC